MRIASLLLTFTLCGSINAALYKKHQAYFDVDSEVSRKADSVYLVRAQGNKGQPGHLDQLYKDLSRFDKSRFTVNDSLAYYLTAGLYETLSYDLERATKSLLTAELLSKKYNKQRYWTAVANYLGNAYYFMKDNASAISYYAAVAAHDSASGSVKSSVLHNIAVLTYEAHQRSTNSKEKDSLAKIITYHYNAASTIQREMKDWHGLASTYSVLVPWHASIGDFKTAYACVDSCRKIANQMGDVGRIAFLRINLGKVLIEDGRYEEALDTLDKAVEHFRNIGDTDQEIHAMAVKTWAYDSLGDYKSSKVTLQAMFNLQKEGFTSTRAKAIGKQEAIFNTKKKELENQLLHAENRQKELVKNRYVLISFVLISLLAASFLFYRNRLRKKALELKKQELDFKDQLVQSNLESEEKERKRIAQELHDGIGQQMTGIQMGLEQLDSKNESISNKLDEIKGQVDTALRSVRSISHQMTPIALQSQGLLAAIEDLTGFVKRNTALDIGFENFNLSESHFPEEGKIHVYRILQEWVQNTLKHANASQASIQLMKVKQDIQLVYSDNGKGFTKSEKPGMGMMNMHSRSELLQGKLTIDSKPGESTFRLIFPLHKPQDEI